MGHLNEEKLNRERNDGIIHQTSIMKGAGGGVGSSSACYGGDAVGSDVAQQSRELARGRSYLPDELDGKSKPERDSDVATAAVVASRGSGFGSLASGTGVGGGSAVAGNSGGGVADSGAAAGSGTGSGSGATAANKRLRKSCTTPATVDVPTFPSSAVTMKNSTSRGDSAGRRCDKWTMAEKGVRKSGYKPQRDLNLNRDSAFNEMTIVEHSSIDSTPDIITQFNIGRYTVQYHHIYVRYA